MTDERAESRIKELSDQLVREVDGLTEELSKKEKSIAEQNELMEKASGDIRRLGEISRELGDGIRKLEMLLRGPDHAETAEEPSVELEA